jgi:hypothetical protein
MASLARPCAARRLSPDHQAELRVSGEKSDMGISFYFYGKRLAEKLTKAFTAKPIGFGCHQPHAFDFAVYLAAMHSWFWRLEKIKHL